ncbi:MAG: potassium transporter Kup [Gemmatimonadetes bacterium]|nr:potassium transporter Kup [Gemmatimonadota bacterium]
MALSKPEGGPDLATDPTNDTAAVGLHARPAPSGRYLVWISMAALGVVYGDIGTSPLYALRESFLDEHGVAAAPENVLGVLSLIFWSLIVIISTKYLAFVLLADNRGEGGILALTSLLTPVGALRGGRRVLILLGLFATALLYGEGMITPAISVLAAVEGLSVATPFFDPYVIPIAIAILIGLFSIQKLGTGGVGKAFGPVTLLWFLTLAALGIPHILREPGVLKSIDPTHAVSFFVRNGSNGFIVLGSVFLVVTGGEALYADMGHFGRRPIRLAWFVVVLPALLLNYFGQGALVMSDPAAVENPFFRMTPTWAIYPVVLIATAATVTASQALISGSFSLTMQAVQLGYSPRVEIDHTSASERGQIYVPAINLMLMLACIGLVLGFKSSSALAAAYGVGVVTTMVVTSVLFIAVARTRWKWNPWVTALLGGSFLAVDLAFLGANLPKITHGGWFPLAVGVVIFSILTTWKKGRQILNERIFHRALPRDLFLQSIMSHPPHRVPGVAVFMYNDPMGTPPALLHNIKHNKVLHEQVVFLSVQIEEIANVPVEDRITVEPLVEGFHQILLHYGFMENVDVPKALADVQRGALRFKPMETTYFLGRETLIPSKTVHGMAVWREKLFGVMSRNARPASSFFRLPPNRVVELGAQIEL